MTVKTGSAWAGLFVTLDATGAKAALTDAAGTLYIDGTADAASVTITGSNPYKWAVTLPALTAGQRVDMYITGTIGTVATAGIVASAQADTALLSDGVAVASIANGAITAAAIADNAIDAGAIATGAITNAKFAAGAIDAAAIAADAIDADAIKADAVTKIQNGLATPTNITAGTITTATNLTNLPAVPTDWLTAAGIKADAVTKIQAGLAPSSDLAVVSGYVDDLETRLTAARAGYLDKLNVSGTLAHSNDAATYKADVSGLMTAGAYVAPDNATIASISSTLGTGVALTAAGVDAILDEVVVGSYTMRQLLKVFAAALAGKATGGGTTTITFRGVDDASNVIVATVDASGNRSAVTLTV